MEQFYYHTLVRYQYMAMQLGGYIRYDGMGLDRTDREEGLSAKGELPVSEEDRPLLGGGIMDRCRTTGRGGREPMAPGCKPVGRGGTWWDCACVARGAGTVSVMVSR